MRGLKHLFVVSFCGFFLCCKDTSNTDIIRNDLLNEIKGFITLSEKHISNFKTNETDTDIYWVEFFEKDEKDVVVIMQQPFIHKTNLDGYIKINDNNVFFYYSNPDFVNVSKLDKSIGDRFPDRNSIEAGLGYSAPNWAYYINDDGLEKFELGQ